MKTHENTKLKTFSRTKEGTREVNHSIRLPVILLKQEKILGVWTGSRKKAALNTSEGWLKDGRDGSDSYESSPTSTCSSSTVG